MSRPAMVRRRAVVLTAILVVALTPVVVRAEGQGLLVGALATVAAGIVVVLASGGRWPAVVAAPVVVGAVGALGMRPSLGLFAAAVAATVAAIVEPHREPWHHPPAIALACGAAGVVGGSVVLLGGDQVVLPASVVGVGLLAMLALGRIRSRREPAPVDRWLDGLPDAMSRRVATAAGAWRDGAERGAGGDRTAGPAPAPGPIGRGARIVVPAAVAVLLVAGGRGRAVLVGVVVAAVVAVACVVLPALARLFGHGVALVVRALVAVISVVFLVPFHLLVLTPIGWVLRALGRRPLEVSYRRGARSYWQVQARPDAAPEPPERMFADERRWTPLDPPARTSGAVVARTVAVVLVVQALVVVGVLAWRDRTEPVPQLAGASDPGASGSAALADLPWAADALRETGEASGGLVSTPYTGWSLRDYEGTYVNIEDRVRRSYEPELAPGVEPLDVWFFGGSTMFGFDLQRDLHTIPSEVARLAEADGIPIRVRNYGAPGYVNYQGAALFSLLATGGDLPDVAVFYDGTNDTSLQLLNEVARFNPPAEPADLYAHIQREALASSGLVPGLTAEPPSPLSPDDADDGPLTAGSVADATISVYDQGIDLARALGERHGVDVVNAWQPDAFSKEPLDPGEAARLEEMGFDERSIAGMRRLSEEVRARLDPEVVDLGDALDEVEGPVLSDTVHVNEVGARAIAEALYRSLEPTLRARLSER